MPTSNTIDGLSVADNFLPAGLVTAAAMEWPGCIWPHWYKYQDDSYQRTTSRCTFEELPPALKLCLAEMAKVSLEDDKCDIWPDLSLYGAGLHEIPAGSQLPIHRDADRHATRPWSRRYSMSLYLTPKWEEEHGGHLRIFPDLEISDGALRSEFFNADSMLISPTFNRLVTRKHTDKAWHEVTKTMITRRSLSLFWYSTLQDARSRATATFI